MWQTGFSDVAWGKATCGYATSAHSLANIKFDAIVQAAQEFMKLVRARNKTAETMDIINIDDDDNEWAHLVNHSDESDVECASLSQLPFHHTNMTQIF